MPSPSSSGLLGLPHQILARILDFLLPSIPSSASTFPQPYKDLNCKLPPVRFNTVGDLYHASLVCRTLHQLATEAIWRAPVIETLESLFKLAEAIRLDVSHNVQQLDSDASNELPLRKPKVKLIRALHLSLGNRSLVPSNIVPYLQLDEMDIRTASDLHTGTDLRFAFRSIQRLYHESLRTIFDHADRIECLSLEDRHDDCDVYEFLHPTTVCRPKKVILRNMKDTEPPFIRLDLSPLSNVTHLHLINVIPPPELLSFLCGKQLNPNAPNPKALDKGLSPCQTLTHLRLSGLPSDSFVSFSELIGQRKVSKQYPSWSDFPQKASRSHAQEALYTMATNSRLLSQLKVLILDLERLPPLCGPEPLDGEPWRLPLDNQAANARRDVTANRQLVATTESTADASVALFQERMVDSSKTEQKDLYWTQIHEGKKAFVDLWMSNLDHGDSVRKMANVCQPETTSDRRPSLTDRICQIDIRIAASSYCSQDVTEMLLNFICESGCFVMTRPLFEPIRADGRNQEMGSWAAKDIFELAKTRPHLSFRSGTGGSYYWTGELPRNV